MKYFGTDGIRGKVNETITVDIAYKVGSFLAHYFAKENKHPKVVLGYDTRLSKDVLASAVSAGLCAHGADVYTLKVTSTPNVAHALKSDMFDCGIMISASHNPYYDNGIKVFNASGEKLDATLELMIEDYIDGKVSIDLANSDAIGQVIDFEQGKIDYIKYIDESISKSSLSKIKIALDLANGSASALHQMLADTLGIDFEVINAKPDGININTDCGSTHPQQLQTFVLENKCDLGLAFDGDADRVIAVDNLGRIVDGDLIMYLCAKHLKQQGMLKHNHVVTTIMSNIGLYKAFDNLGIDYCKVNVGDKYVYAKMKEEDYSLGGEQSGHIIFKDKATTGDGILTGLLLAQIVAQDDKTFALLVDEVTIYPQLLKNIIVKDKNALLADKRLLDLVESIDNTLKGDGRVLVRASGTEQMVRVMVEAATVDICELYVTQMSDLVTELNKEMN